MCIKGGCVGVLIQIQRPKLVLELSDELSPSNEPVPRLRIRFIDRVENAAERTDHRQGGSIRARVHHAVEFPPANRCLARKRNSEVPGARLHDFRSCFEQTILFSRPHKSMCCPGLGATARIEGLQFSPDTTIGAPAEGSTECVQAHKWSRAYRAENSVARLNHNAQFMRTGGG